MNFGFKKDGSGGINMPFIKRKQLAAMGCHYRYCTLEQMLDAQAAAGFKTLEFENREIAWLLIVPISEQEKNYAIANGWEALEDIFEKADIDIFNLNRKSII